MKARCDHCKKKVGLISFECRCAMKSLCTNCKLPETHLCKSLEEFKVEEKKIIQKNNPLVVSDKLIKI